jgi:hypothetical protein
LFMGFDGTVIYGESTPQVTLRFGCDKCHPDAPRVYFAEAGFSDFMGRESSRPDYWDLEQLALRMREAQDGMFIAFVENGDLRPLALIQDDRGAFYASVQGQLHSGRPAWKEFFHAAGYVTFEYVDWLWRPPEVCLMNFSGGGSIPRNAATALFEGFGMLIDRRTLALRKLCIDGHGDIESALAEAAAVLNAEQHGAGRASYRERIVETWDPEAIGIDPSQLPVRLLKVKLPQREVPLRAVIALASAS